MKLLTLNLRLPLFRYPKLHNTMLYSTKFHPTKFSSLMSGNGKQALSTDTLLQSVMHLHSPILQTKSTIATTALDETISDWQRNSITLAKRLVQHIHDQASLEPSVNTREAQDKINLYRQLISHADDMDSVVNEINELLEMIDNSESGDPELVEMATQDLSSVLMKFEQKFNIITAYILPDHAYDAKSAVLEVQAGAGGNEASLFAEEIFDLYVEYSKQNFDVDVTIVDKHSGEGIDKATAIVNGVGAFRLLKYECGVHRVQRVPKASTGNKSDRLQTSTCSVAVLPVPDETDNQIPEKELDIKFVRSSAPGGQNVNKLDTCCQMTHIPTGFSVKCQEFRTQHQNKAKALKAIQSMVYQQAYEKQMKETKAFRKSQIGNMNRNEKIRTYNFTRNQITDHRIDKGTRQVPDIIAFFNGKLGYEVIGGLRDKIALEHQIKCLDEYLTSF